ncbi:MAG: hypothetical protein ACYS9X_02665 [Planctomycetota bacterium]|jgi:hypothetical protein
MPEAEGPEGAGELDELAPLDGAEDSAKVEATVDDVGDAKGEKAPSSEAVERLKARAGRRSSRRGGSARKGDSTRGGSSRRGGRSSRRRLSDEERQALWQKAVARKARKIKVLTDLLVFVCLGCVLGAHALVFAHKRANLGGGIDVEYGPKRGYEVMLDLVKINLEGEGDAPLVGLGTKPRMLREGGVLRVLEPAEPADVWSMLILIVPVGAALLLFLYLLDYLVWMGRPLPLLSLLYGFGAVAYLMVTRVPENGAWSIIGVGGRQAMAAWFLLLIPLFLLGTFSLLRIFFSARRKRYAFAGLEPPSSSAPPKPAPAEGEAKGEAESAVESGDGAHEKADSRPESDADTVDDNPYSYPDRPAGPDAADAPPDADAGADVTKTPVSSPAIKLDLSGAAGQDADAAPGLDAEADEGPATSPFD